MFLIAGAAVAVYLKRRPRRPALATPALDADEERLLAEMLGAKEPEKK